MLKFSFNFYTKSTQFDENFGSVYIILTSFGGFLHNFELKKDCVNFKYFLDKDSGSKALSQGSIHVI